MAVRVQPHPVAQPDGEGDVRRPARQLNRVGDTDNPLTGELVAWADTIFVMERVYRTPVQQHFRPYLNGKRLICRDIPDAYACRDTALMALSTEAEGMACAGRPWGFGHPKVTKVTLVRHLHHARSEHLAGARIDRVKDRGDVIAWWPWCRKAA